MQLDVSGNALDFGAIEDNLTGPQQHPFGAFWYGNQRPPDPADTVAYLPGGTFRASREIAGTHSMARGWQREVGGVWTMVPGANGPQLVVATAGEANRGLYRLRMTNGWVPGVVQYSRAVYADLLPYPALPENRPVDAPGTGGLAGPGPASRGTVSDPLNYVRTFAPRVALTDTVLVRRAGANTVQMSTAYLDGLGRAVQTVQRGASPAGRDLVQPMAYDALERQAVQYLPYAVNPATSAQAGAYRPDALFEQDDFYRATPIGPGQRTDGVVRTGAAFGTTYFEDSPLSRVLAQTAPGEHWQLATGRAVSMTERPNTAADSVQQFVPGYEANANDITAQLGGYPNGTLWGTQSTDEHGYRTLVWERRIGAGGVETGGSPAPTQPRHQVLDEPLASHVLRVRRFWALAGNTAARSRERDAAPQLAGNADGGKIHFPLPLQRTRLVGCQAGAGTRRRNVDSVRCAEPAGADAGMRRSAGEASGLLRNTTRWATW